MTGIFANRYQHDFSGFGTDDLFRVFGGTFNRFKVIFGKPMTALVRLRIGFGIGTFNGSFTSIFWALVSLRGRFLHRATGHTFRVNVANGRITSHTNFGLARHSRATLGQVGTT